MSIEEKDFLSWRKANGYVSRLNPANLANLENPASLCASTKEPRILRIPFSDSEFHDSRALSPPLQ